MAEILIADYTLGANWATLHTQANIYAQGDNITVHYDDTNDIDDASAYIVRLNDSIITEFKYDNGDTIALLDIDAGKDHTQNTFNNYTECVDQGGGGSITYKFSPNYQLFQDPNPSGGLARSGIVFPFIGFGLLGPTVSDESCALVSVCTLQFIGEPFLSHPTAVGSFDGQVTVFSEGAKGVVPLAQYSMSEDFDYQTEGQISPTFTGLGPGEYTIYAKDSTGCKDSISFALEVGGGLSNYGLKYQIDYKSYIANSVGSLFDMRLEVLERDYTGAASDLHCGASPVTLEYPNIDILEPVAGSALSMEILNQTDFQYIEFFTSDLKKYKFRFLVNSALVWQGYSVPNLFSEQYTYAPYSSQIRATCGLGLLQYLDFVQNTYINRDDKKVTVPLKGRMSQLSIILFILNKLQFGASLRVALNIFEQSHASAATDTPLAQTYIDVRAFYNSEFVADTCLEVLRKILKPYKARIFQKDGIWYIVRVDELVGSYDYVEYDYLGAQTSNGTINPVVDVSPITSTDCLTYIADSVTLDFSPQLSSSKVCIDLYKKNSLVNGYFDEDIEAGLLGAAESIKDWQYVNVEGSTQMTVREADRGFWLNVKGKGNNHIISLDHPFEWQTGDKMVLSFDYIINLFHAQINLATPTYTRLKWKLKLTDGATDYWLGSNKQWYNVDILNVIRAKQYDIKSSYKIEVDMPPEVEAFDGTVQLSLYSMDVSDYDISGADQAAVATGIRSIATVDQFEGEQIAGAYIHSGIPIFALYYVDYYTLQSGTDADDGLDILRPDDYAASTNEKVWVRDRRDKLHLNVDVEYNNVQVELMPSGMSYDKDICIGSGPASPSTIVPQISDINLAFGDKTDINSIEHYHYNFLQLSDGSFTQGWQRDGITENKTLQQIIKDSLEVQGSRPQYKLRGSFHSDILVDFGSVVRENFDGGRLYRVNGLQWDSIAMKYELELVEIIDTPPSGQVEIYSNEYTNEYA